MANVPAKLPTRYTEARCHVCQSPYREEIERSIMMTHSASRIASHYEELGVTGITRKSVTTHAKKHMTAEQEAVRQLVEEHAMKMYNDVEAAKGLLLTEEALLETGLAKFWEMMLSGDMEWAPKDAILFLDRADKLKARMAESKVAETENQFRMFMESVQAVVPEEYWRKIGEHFKSRIDATRPKSLEELVVIPERNDNA